MEYCMTKECVEEYLDKLEESIAEYMAMPVNVRSTEAIDSMIECWERIKSMHKMIWPEPSWMTETPAKTNWRNIIIIS